MQCHRTPSCTAPTHAAAAYVFLQFDGFVSRDELAKQDEDAGLLEFREIWNDGSEQHFVWLIGVCARSHVRCHTNDAMLDNRLSVSVVGEARPVCCCVEGACASRCASMTPTGLKNIIAQQLPKMPREYIVRLVLDRYVFVVALFASPEPAHAVVSAHR